MADEVTITNQALAYLGVDPVSSLDDDIKSARLAKALYYDIRDSLIEDADWSFAIKLFKVAQDANKPLFGQGFYFTIPSEVLRIITVNENSYPWSIEGKKVRTSTSEANMETVSQITNVNDMSPMFRQAFATKMAMDMALPLTQSKTIFGSMTELFYKKMDEAKADDGMQGTSKKFRKGRLIDARTNGSDLGGRSNVFGPYV